MEAIIETINTEVCHFLAENGITANANGIAEPIIIDEVGEAEQTRPAIIDENGEINSDLFDDRYPIGFYHKLSGKTFVSTTQMGYGDAIAYTEESDMFMVVFGLRSVIHANDLEQRISHIIQHTQAKKGGKSTYCILKSVLCDRTQVFANEFKGVQFFLQPNIFLFRINYKIITARTTCI